MSAYQIAHKTANAISVFCFGLVLLGSMDLMLLPKRSIVETIEGIEKVSYPAGSRYRRSTLVEDEDRVILQAQHHRLAVGRSQSFNYQRGDTLEISLSPLFGMVAEAHLLKAQQQKRFQRKSSLLGNFSFLPWALFFTAFMGLINHKNPSQANNFASGSLVLMLVMLLMIVRI